MAILFEVDQVLVCSFHMAQSRTGELPVQSSSQAAEEVLSLITPTGTIRAKD